MFQARFTLLALFITLTLATLSAQEALDQEFDAQPGAPWFASDGYSNGSMFDCTWRATQARIADGVLSLTLDKDSPHINPPYKSAEFRTSGFYGYGVYEVSMKPAKNPGIVSSFFTYSGPADKKPWDEIDFEFLGKDTTKVQVNWFKNGKGRHEHLINLGFDASEEFHAYGFEWRKGSVTFSIDGKQAYQAKSEIPETPGHVIVNLWPGKGVNDWLKAYTGTTPLVAQYKYIKYNP